MKPAPSKTPQSKPEVVTTSWAEVARVSAALAPGAAVKKVPVSAGSAAKATDSTFPGGSALQAGDSVQHEKFGRCTVHRIASGFVHMAPENGRVIKLSQNIVTFTPAFIKDGRRVFSTSTRQ